MASTGRCPVAASSREASLRWDPLRRKHSAASSPLATPLSLPRRRGCKLFVSKRCLGTRSSRVSGARASRGRGSVVTRAFLQNEELTQVALDAYKVLGVSRMATKETITEAYDRLILGSPAEECSQDLLCARASVLKTATETLLDPMRRRAFDQSEMLEMEQMDLPGAIALLVEAEDWETAIEWGEAWLAGNASDACAGDVALCLGMAHYGVAVGRVERSLDNALGCEAGLRTGLQLLRRHGVGVGLQAELEETLEALAPQIALQLIRAEAGAQDRSRGVRMLPGVLRGKDGRTVASFPALKMSRAAYLETLRSHLSAAEQVQAFEGVLSQPDLSDEERYNTALAQLAAGHGGHNPSQVKAALQTLEGLDNKLEPTTGRKRFDAIDVSVELAVAHLLLGSVRGAESSLGLGASPARNPDPGVRQFVLSHSGEGEQNTLPGITALAQQWMADVLAARFQEVDPSPAMFDHWYRHPRVMLYLQVVDKGIHFGADGAGSFVGRLVAAIMAFWHRLVAALTGPRGKAPQAVASPAAVASLAATSPMQSFSEVDHQAGSSSEPLAPASHSHTAVGGVEPAVAVIAATPSAASSELLNDFDDAFPPVAAIAANPPVPLGEKRYFGGPEVSKPQEEASRLPSFDPEPPLRSPLGSPPSSFSGARQERPSAREQVEVPLAAVTSQTVGQIQKHMQDVLPLLDDDEAEDGFSTEYHDQAVLKYPGMRHSRSGLARPSGVPKLLEMEGEQDMWRSNTNKMTFGKALRLALGFLCLGAALWYGYTKLGPDVTTRLPLFSQVANLVEAKGGLGRQARVRPQF